MSKTVVCKDVAGKEYVVPVAELRWRPSVYAVVIKQDKILLSKQFGDKYDLPGGGVELGEGLEEAVIREVKEETGINVDNPVQIGMVESYFTDSHAENERYHCLLFYYSCQFAGGELSTEGFDEWEKQYVEMAEWVPLNKINEIKIASTVDYRPFIKRASKV